MACAAAQGACIQFKVVTSLPHVTSSTPDMPPGNALHWAYMASVPEDFPFMALSHCQGGRGRYAGYILILHLYLLISHNNISSLFHSIFEGASENRQEKRWKGFPAIIQCNSRPTWGSFLDGWSLTAALGGNTLLSDRWGKLRHRPDPIGTENAAFPWYLRVLNHPLELLNPTYNCFSKSAPIEKNEDPLSPFPLWGWEWISWGCMRKPLFFSRLCAVSPKPFLPCFLPSWHSDLCYSTIAIYFPIVLELKISQWRLLDTVHKVCGTLTFS